MNTDVIQPKQYICLGKWGVNKCVFDKDLIYKATHCPQRIRGR